MATSDSTTDVRQNAAGDNGASSLKYRLLGPSLTKAGQEQVDQSKVSDVIYNASRGSKFFNQEEARDKILTEKIAQMLERKRQLEKQGTGQELRHADKFITELEATRDLTQHIVHIDCDSFFAAVEQIERPELKEMPFAVGGSVLTTCNYVARQFGCRSGMAGFVAKKLCPELILIKPNFQKYTAKAQEIREILVEYDAQFESASIDEAYLNITAYCASHDIGPAEMVEQMRREIHQKTNITVSAGIAANTKLAKICSNLNKPNGQYVLPRDRNAILTFMRDLSTRKVHGIGRVLERELLEIGVKTCGDIYHQRQYLRQLLGKKTFEFLLTCYLGLGRTRVQPSEEYERKSVGTESTFGEISDPITLREKLRRTAEELEGHMKRAECKGRTLCLKVKLHTFEVLTRQVVTPRAICLADDLYNYSLPMLAKLERDVPGIKLRLLGLRCTHLASSKKPDAAAFFGPQCRKAVVDDAGYAPSISSNASNEEASWKMILEGEEYPDLDDATADMDSPEPRPDESDRLSYGLDKRETAPSSKKHHLEEAEDLWDCPVCSRPQVANQRQFNEHIDSCLSRQTIRDAIRADRDPPSAAENEQQGTAKEGRVGAARPKQRKLSFK
ncbi:hypothetical protein RJ55_00523 [Drechmeria coniospora]|nr:hypothetical protein RJ55_00523 [Drechmeria coniospora]